jgi:D-alanyl-lipoteichoic acid acyltransferase DltB (MBOAT superfamily)
MKLNYKIIGSTLSAMVLFGILLWCANSSAVSPDEIEFVLHISVMVAGAAIGWIIGILASPYGEKEKEQFSTIVKGVTVFFSGYALAKVDPIITALLKPEAILQPVVAFRAIAFLTSFLLAMIIAFVYRKYGR